MANGLIAEIEGGVVTADHARVRLRRLQQICAGWVKCSETDELLHADTSKEDALEMIISGMHQDDHVVVFGRFSSDLMTARGVAERLGRPYFEVSGNLKDGVNERGQMNVVEGLPGHVVGVQIDSGGAGIDLTAARYAVYFSVGYSRGKYDQSVSRIHRPGQERNTHCYHLQCKGTVDEHVYRALKSKKDIIASVLQSLGS
mgnify:FL=1